MRFCKRPFENIEIDENLDVYTCCPWFVNHFNIGNLKKSSYDEIWNSDNAKLFRLKILNSDYTLCNLKKCCDYDYLPDIPEDYIKDNYSEKMPKFPKHIFLNYDKICNAKCIICRDNCIENNTDKVSYLNNLAEEKILPLLKSAETVYLSGSGEVFYSQHSQYLLKRISELYPNIRFEIVSNGLFCNRENITKLGLSGKIDKLTLSIHAATKETYKKIVRAGSFDIISNNLKELEIMLNSGDIKFIQLVFIVNSVNFREMPIFAEMAKKHNMVAVFCEYVPKSDTEMGIKGEDYLVHIPSHPMHNDLLKVLKDKRLELSDYCFLNPIFNELRKKVSA